MKEQGLEFLQTSEYGRYTAEILNFFIPLAFQLLQLRDNPSLMAVTVKTVGVRGFQDIVTEADNFMQRRIKEEVEKIHPEWQFWGEEGEDNVTEYDPTKSFLLITDPIEGTTNFKNGEDDIWGSVVALVDIKTKEPVIGIVAHPSKRQFYLGIRGRGAYLLVSNEDSTVSSLIAMTNEPEDEDFTYNNSPYFGRDLSQAVAKFLSFGEIQPIPDNPTDLEKARRTVIISDEKGSHSFLDLESGLLEVIRNRGTIHFSTGNEMAAGFVILQEIGGVVTDADGQPWHLGINSLISARNKEDYNFLKSLYDKAKGVK